MNPSTDHNPLFPKGDEAPANYFTGAAWLKVLVPTDAGTNCQVANVVFDAGARTNWHTHAGGQILIVTDGTGYYQETGKAKQVLRKGDVLNIPPQVKHWHGATAHSSFTHIAINPQAQHGAAEWLEPVSEEEYRMV